MLTLRSRVQCLKGDAPASGKAKGSSSAAAASSSSSAGAPGQDVSDAARSKFAFPAPPGGKPAARPEPKAAKEKEKSKGPFEYEIVHQTRLDVSNTWKDQRATKDGTQPDKLVVRVKMPEVAAVSEITLDTSKTTLLVAAHGKCAAGPHSALPCNLRSLSSPATLRLAPLRKRRHAQSSPASAHARSRPSAAPSSDSLIH